MWLSNANGHITLNTPVLVQSLKLSNVESSQYLDGWPPGNTGCCWLLFFCIFWFFFPVFSINLWYCLKCLNFAPKMCKMPYNQKIYFWKSMIQKSSGNTFFTMTKSCFFSSLKIQSFFSKLFINWRNFSNFKDLLSIF